MDDEGWYPDPFQPTHLRWWNGQIWTSHVRVTPPATRDRTVSPFSASSIEPLARHVIDIGVKPVLRDAVAREIIDQRQHDEIVFLVNNQWPRQRIPPPVAATPAAALDPTATRVGTIAPARQTTTVLRAPVAPSPPSEAQPEVPAATPRGPSRLVRFRSAISAELAVHGLAYLGVLLLFAGVTGLTVFSTGDVRRGLRPVAELAAPASLLFAAWFLRRRHSTVVAAALEVLAAAVLPVALLASWIDGADFPPDPGDAARVWVLAATCAALTLGYAWYARRRPTSPWRYFVAPVGWLSAAMAALATAPQTPSSDDVAVPVPWQWALVLVAIAATGAIIRRLGPGPTATAAASELLPGAGVSLLLAVIAAGREHWSEWPLMVAALASVIVFEYQTRWFARAMAPLQAVALAGAFVPLIPVAGFGRAGVGGVVGALVLLERTLRRDSDSMDPGVAQATLAFLGAVVGLALAASAAEAWTMALAFFVVTGWAHARRIRVPAASTSRSRRDWIAAIAPLGIGVAIARAFEPGPTTITLAIAIVAIAAAIRIRAHADRFWVMWITTLATLAVAVAAIPLTTQDLRSRAIGAVIACVAIVLSTAPRPLRLWVIAAAFHVPVALLGTDAGLAPTTIAAAMGTAAVLPVVASIVRTRLAGHLGLIGHIVGLGASAVAASDPAALTVAVWAALVGSVITVIVQVTRGSDTVSLLAVALTESIEPSEARVFADVVPSVLASAMFPLGVGLLLHRTDAISVDDPWLGVAVAACAVIVAAAAILTRSCGAVRTAFDATSLIIALTGVGNAAQELDSLTAATWVALAATLLALWPLHVHRAWLGWTLFAAVTVLSAATLEVPTDRLYLTAGVWGTAVALATLWWDDRRDGRRSAGVIVRTVTRRGPFVLGIGALTVAQILAFGRPRTELGWVSLVGAAVALCLTLMLRLPPLSLGAWGLAAVAGVALAPWDTFDTPWTLSLAAIAPIAFASVLRVRPASADWWRRWDLPAEIAGATISIVAITLAPRVEQQPLTFAFSGAVCLAAGGWWRRVEVAGGGALLVVMGAVAAGHGWGATALFAVALAATGAVTRLASTARTVALLTSVAATAGGWIELALFLEWDANETIQATALAGGLLALSTAVVARVRSLGSEWVIAWAGSGTAAVGIATALQIDVSGSVHSDSQYALAAGMALISMALGLLAKTAPRLSLGELAAVVALGASAEIGLAVDITTADLALIGSVAGFLVAVALLVVFRYYTNSKWLPALGTWGWGMTLAATVAAIDELPRRHLLALAFLVGATELAAAGIVVRRVQLLKIAVALTSAAWIVFASAEVTAWDWYTVPIGVAFICIVALHRADGRRRQKPIKGAGTLAAEFFGMGLVVAPAIVEIVVDAPSFAAVAIGGGAAIATWGALTRVRRRLFFGSSSVIVAVIILVGIPVTRLIARPQSGSDSGPIGLWLGLAAAGIVALASAAMIEEGRRRVRRAVLRIGEITEGWE
ncbi:MAG: DUF2510 domain-containing protein [Acidimicrobiales bacterium]